MDGARRIRSEKLRKHWYIEGYGRCLKNKRVEWEEDSNAEQWFAVEKREAA